LVGVPAGGQIVVPHNPLDKGLRRRGQDELIAGHGDQTELRPQSSVLLCCQDQLAPADKGLVMSKWIGNPEALA